jgi:hypothetical protein
MAITSYNDIPSLIEAWLPANATLSGSNVTALPGAFNARTLTTPAADPQLVVGGLPSGADSIELDGSGPYFQLLESNLVAGTSTTFLAAIKLTGSLVANGRVFGFAQSGQPEWNNNQSFVFHSEGGNWPEGYHNGTLPDNGAMVGADVWHLLLAIFDGSAFTWWVAEESDTDWVQVATGSYSNTLDVDEFRIGAYIDGSNRQPMEFGDVVWYSDALDGTERQDLFDYAHSRNFTGAPDEEPAAPIPTVFRF